MPKVSVVIPTYKHRDHVLAAVGSAFDQGYPDLEVIVVNDGSPDDTAGVLRPLAEAGRIRYVEQPNAGQAAARNRGLAEARGRYVALLDDDDTWPPGGLAALVAALDADPAVVLAYGYAEIARAGEPTYRFPAAPGGPSGDVFDRFVGEGWLRSPGQALMRTATLRAAGGLDPVIWGTDDWDLYLTLSAAGRFAYVDRCTLRYQLHAGNASNQFWRMFVNARKVRRKHFGPVPTPGNWSRWWRCTRFIRTFCGNEARGAAFRENRAGDGRAAARLLLQAVAMNPGLAAQWHTYSVAADAVGGLKIPVVSAVLRGVGQRYRARRGTLPAPPVA